MEHRGISLLLIITVAAALGSGSMIEHAKDRAGLAVEEERLQDGEEKAQSWASWALLKAYQLIVIFLRFNLVNLLLCGKI